MTFIVPLYAPCNTLARPCSKVATCRGVSEAVIKIMRRATSENIRRDFFREMQDRTVGLKSATS